MSVEYVPTTDEERELAIQRSPLVLRDPTPDGLIVDGRHPSVQHFGPLFAYGHLREPMQSVSMFLATAAQTMVDTLQDGPELSVGLRSLLGAKDCFVRQAVTDMKAGKLPSS